MYYLAIICIFNLSRSNGLGKFVSEMWMDLEKTASEGKRDKEETIVERWKKVTLLPCSKRFSNTDTRSNMKNRKYTERTGGSS